MTPYHSQHNVTIYCDDCVTAMQNMEDNSIDAIVTDPPYGLSKQPDIVEVLTHWLNGDDYEHTGGGFMGRAWDSFVPGPSVWRECLRVLKPGAHLLAFAGTRTVDLMGISLRLGGFEIRDTITNLYDTNRRFQALWETLDTEQRKLFHQVLDTDGLMGWGFGQGFPKSLDIGKAIDKANGNPLGFMKFAIAYKGAIEKSKYNHNDIDKLLGIKTSSCYWERTDHRGGIPPRRHWRKIKELLDLDDGFEQLYKEAERKVVGQSNRKGKPPQPMWGEEDGQSWKITAPATPEAKQWDGFGTGLKPAIEPVLLCRKPISEKNIAANVLRWGTGSLNIDGCRIETEENLGRINRDTNGVSPFGVNDNSTYGNGESNFVNVPIKNQGRFPANLILSDDEEVRELFPETGKSNKTKQSDERYKAKVYNGSGYWGSHNPDNSFNDSGSAARFFYCAKSSKAERNAGLEGMPVKRKVFNGKSAKSSPDMKGVEERFTPQPQQNNHPTVKPLALMRYLCRLITPPNGLILDPFAGSGSTLIAAREENFKAIGVELEEDYCQIAVGRLSQVQPNLFNTGD